MLIHVLAAGLVALGSGMLVAPGVTGRQARSRLTGTLDGESASFPAGPADGGWWADAARGVRDLDPVGLLGRWWRAEPRPVRHVRAVWLVGALAPAALGLLVAGPVAGVVATIGTIGVARCALRARERRWRAATESAAGEAVGALVAELRAGRHPGPALLLAAHAAPDVAGLRAAAAAAAWGGDVPTALNGPNSGAAAPLLHALAAAWTVAETSGAGLADVLGRVEADLRSTTTLRAETAAELAGTRATARLLALLPLLGIALGAGLGAHPVHVLLHTPIGAACSGAGLFFCCVGLAWTARLTGAAVHGR